MQIITYKIVLNGTKDTPRINKKRASNVLFGCPQKVTMHSKEHNIGLYRLIVDERDLMKNPSFSVSYCLS